MFSRIKKYTLSFLVACSLSPFTTMAQSKSQPKVLVFSKTTGFRHDCIPSGKEALIKLGNENNFTVDTTEDATAFTSANLSQYAAILFFNTTGDVLDSTQQLAMQSYIQKGGGYMGIHAAADTEYDWPWYNQLAGAWFASHPKQQEASLLVIDHNHPATQHLPNSWIRWDEWYNFKDINADTHVLIKIDERSYQGGKNGDNHPMAWYHQFDGGRAFYTALGHTQESYKDPAFLQHILGGLRYAMGTEKNKDRKERKQSKPGKTVLAR
ncbi:ThuA domain-containing protein [Chitinophaga pendula]|nr:ThuA domain-containing protein [Chitinophaga pendula]